MRLPLIAAAELNPDQRPLYDDMKSGIEGHFRGFKAIGDDGALLGPWNPMLKYQPMGQAMWEMIKSISFSATLPKPVREVGILVTGAKFDAAYELYAHVRVADAAGLSEAKIATIAAGNKPVDLSLEESVAYDAATALMSGATLPEPTWKMLLKTFGEKGAAEFVYLVGVYALVSVILNGFDVPVPETT